MADLAEVCEFHEGFHGGNYYFVIESYRLIHISRYAVSEKNVYGKVCYLIDLGRVKGKTIVLVSSSKKSGLFEMAWVFPGENLALDISKLLSVSKSVPLADIINSYEPAHLTHLERQLIDEWNRFYRSMGDYIRRETFGKGGYMFATDFIEFHIRYDLKYPASLLLPYSKNAGLKSYDNVAKQIHQIWVIVRILREFTSQKLNLHFKQSSSMPLAIINGYGMWYEFDLNPISMCEGMFWDSESMSFRIPPNLKKVYEVAKADKMVTSPSKYALRPDIVFTYATSCSEFIEHLGRGRPAVKLIIECKNTGYVYWAKDVEVQIKPYAKIFQPEYIVAASMKSVPREVKERLRTFGVDVIDNVYPGGAGEKELVKYVKDVLSWRH